MNGSDILDRLYAVIEDRKNERPDDSYVVKLLDGGVSAIGAKIREEAEEVVDAATRDDADHLANEVADVLFHTWVMMAAKGVRPDDVYTVLDGRFGLGGLEEKRRRGEDDDAGR